MDEFTKKIKSKRMQFGVNSFVEDIGLVDLIRRSVIDKFKLFRDSLELKIYSYKILLDLSRYILSECQHFIILYAGN